MRCHPIAPQPQGVAGAIHCHLPHSLHSAGPVADLRSCALLSRADYWLLNEHRRRCEELGGPRLTRLARLIRTKLLEALVTDAEDLPADVVTGTSRATFAIDRRPPETRPLYPWDYPGHERRPLPVGSFLGVTLIGMSAGQRRRFADGNGKAGELQVLAVHPQGTTGATLFD